MVRPALAVEIIFNFINFFGKIEIDLHASFVDSVIPFIFEAEQFRARLHKGFRRKETDGLFFFCLLILLICKLKHVSPQEDSVLFGLFKKKQPPSERPKQFPPVPDWQPAISLPIERIVERFRFYTNGTRDFAVFEHGTVAILPSNLSDEAAKEHAALALRNVFHAHPDMNPMNMKDGNILIQYNHDVASLVLSDVAEQNWSEIDRQHQQAIATSEVLITPLGHNVFDDFGKKALFGRCYMFMDAQSPKVTRIERHEG